MPKACPEVIRSPFIFYLSQSEEPKRNIAEIGYIVTVLLCAYKDRLRRSSVFLFEIKLGVQRDRKRFRDGCEGAGRGGRKR